MISRSDRWPTRGSTLSDHGQQIELFLSKKSGKKKSGKELTSKEYPLPSFGPLSVTGALLSFTLLINY